ncbi:MAG: hypothetical protein C0608_01650 [Deltaproteobacteria bacterium]|nr:MAG: hypothetical protein C0608_01650 [Deltaproteobacteria bacterium]
MSANVDIKELYAALEETAKLLDRVEETGGSIKAIERNVRRMRGTLRTMMIHFEDLAVLEGK